MEELQNLYKLQEIELQLEKLQQTQKSLPVIAEFKKLQAETVRAKEKLLRAKSDFAELCKQQKGWNTACKGTRRNKSRTQRTL